MSNSNLEDVVEDWWGQMNSSRKGDRNNLRRSHSLSDAKTKKEYFRLRRLLLRELDSPPSPNQIGSIALTFSRSDSVEDSDMNFGRLIGKSGISESRFKSLLDREKRSDLCLALRKIIPQLEWIPLSLASDIYYWSSSVRQDWSKGFYEERLDTY
jgi:CRISPR type I-E-associated protein CasB/Cse2